MFLESGRKKKDFMPFFMFVSVRARARVVLLTYVQYYGAIEPEF